MKTNIDHLSATDRKQLQMLTQVITKAIRPEKIILYGINSIEYGINSEYGINIIETPDPGPGIHKVTPGMRRGYDMREGYDMQGGYDLLVVTRRGDRRYDHEIQDIIENRCRMHATVTILVHDIDHVNQRLSEGQYFFSLMSREAILLYDAGSVPFSATAPPDLVRIRLTAQKDFERWSRQARAFFNSALFNLQQKEPRLVIFLLHQAAEHIYQAILLAFMGYKPCTHNLDKLRRYTHRFSIELAFLFPRDGAGEDRLFKLLLQSYVDARYKEDYQVTENELQQLTQRIEKLLAIAGRICHNRFISLEKMAAMEGVRLGGR